MPAPSKAWVVITDGQVDAESPIDTTFLTGVRDNLIHLEEWLGHSYTAQQDHNHDNANSSYLGDATVSPAKLGGMAAGDIAVNYNPTERTTTSIEFVKLKETKLGAGGTYRIKFKLRTSNADYPAYSCIYRNGVAVEGTEQYTTSTTYVEYSEDISGWVGEDLLQVYERVYQGGATAYTKDLDIYAIATHFPVNNPAY